MIYPIFILALQLLASCYGAPTDSRTAQAFLENRLVPNIILTAPENFIQVNYSNIEVNLGNRFNPLQTTSPPRISFDADDNELYTFVFFGPDLPPALRPPYTQFLHWLVVNIPGKSLENGDTISSHFPPLPYPGGFPYLFLLYKQNAPIDPNAFKNLSNFFNRPHFDVINLQEVYKLTGPIAGNFMREVYLPPFSQPSN